MRRTTPVGPVEPAPLFCKQSKGSTSRGLTLNPEPDNQKARATFVRQTWLSLFYQLFAFDKVVSILFSGF